MDGMFPQLRGWGDVPGAALPAAEVRGLSTWPRGAGVKVGPPAREREAWEVGGSRAGTGVCGLRLHRPGEQVSLLWLLLGPRQQRPGVRPAPFLGLFQ